jgi:hypothetical protein
MKNIRLMKNAAEFYGVTVSRPPTPGELIRPDEWTAITGKEYSPAAVAAEVHDVIGITLPRSGSLMPDWVTSLRCGLEPPDNRQIEIIPHATADLKTKPIAVRDELVLAPDDIFDVRIVGPDPEKLAYAWGIDPRANTRFSIYGLLHIYPAPDSIIRVRDVRLRDVTCGPPRCFTAHVCGDNLIQRIGLTVPRPIEAPPPEEPPSQPSPPPEKAAKDDEQRLMEKGVSQATAGKMLKATRGNVALAMKAIPLIRLLRARETATGKNLTLAHFESPGLAQEDFHIGRVEGTRIPQERLIYAAAKQIFLAEELLS